MADGLSLYGNRCPGYCLPCHLGQVQRGAGDTRLVEEGVAHEFNHQARVLLVVIESQVGQALNIAFF